MSRSLTITEERACSMCFKRIGTTAFVATDGGALLQHFSCYKRAPQTAASLADYTAQVLPDGLSAGI